MLPNNLTHFLDQLWNQYTERNPEVLRLYNLLIDKGENVVNDHIAYRTFNHPKVHIEQISKPLIALGYKPVQDYVFDAKKLNAVHFEHPAEDAPLIFISELKTEEFSPFVQETVKQLIDKVDADSVPTEAFLYGGRPWGDISYEVYEKLREESEYGAWLYAEGYRANHFTVFVNALTTMTDIRELNAYLKTNGFLMNNPACEIQGSKEQLLEQSSIKAALVDTEFIEGTKKLTGCFYEFAQRYMDADGNLFRGFIASSADKIFESTNLYQK